MELNSVDLEKLSIIELESLGYRVTRQVQDLQERLAKIDSIVSKRYCQSGGKELVTKPAIKI